MASYKALNTAFKAIVAQRRDAVWQCDGSQTAAIVKSELSKKSTNFAPKIHKYGNQF